MLAGVVVVTLSSMVRSIRSCPVRTVWTAACRSNLVIAPIRPSDRVMIWEAKSGSVRIDGARSGNRRPSVWRSRQ
jgi:hypothetical protein